MVHFDQLFLISLPERRDSAIRRLYDVGPVAEDVVFITAFRGDVIGVPSWWRAGGGAWGCYTSHLHALHRVWQSGAERALIVEDDVIFAPDFQSKLSLLMENVPEDWGQLYLGGQFRGQTEQINKYVLRPSRINRTHAYAVTRSAIPSILRHLTEYEGFLKEGQVFHIDHHYEEAHAKRAWGVYAPTWWLCGQGETHSAVNGRLEWPRWWHNDVFAEHLPLVVCPAGHPVTPGLHFGYHAEKTWCPYVAGAMHNPNALRHRLIELKHEALRHNYLPAVSHAFLTLERAALLSTETCQLRPVAWCNETVNELLNYPQNGLLPTPYYTRPGEKVGAPARPAHGHRSDVAADGVFRSDAETETTAGVAEDSAGTRDGTVEPPGGGTGPRGKQGAGGSPVRIARSPDGESAAA